MRTIKLLAAAAFLFCPARVEAGPAECAIIRDHDERMMCFAATSHNASWCAFIKNHDTRVRCNIITGH